MSIQSLNTAATLPQSVQSSLSTTKPTSGDLPFADMIKGLVKETDQQQLQAQEGVRQLVTGEAESIHDVVLTTSRADLAFRLMMEIRNRLISSYQEVMRMQV